MKREFLQNLMENMPKEAVDAIMEENGRDIHSARQAAQAWEEKYHQAVRNHEKELGSVRFESLLREQIAAFGGRNRKAITALLDVEALQASGKEADLAQALTALKQECGYLFREDLAPRYAPGTGSLSTAPEGPQTMAGALRERFSREND